MALWAFTDVFMRVPLKDKQLDKSGNPNSRPQMCRLVFLCMVGAKIENLYMCRGGRGTDKMSVRSYSRRRIRISEIPSWVARLPKTFSPVRRVGIKEKELGHVEPLAPVYVGRCVLTLCACRHALSYVLFCTCVAVILCSLLCRYTSLSTLLWRNFLQSTLRYENGEIFFNFLRQAKANSDHIS